MAALDHRVQRRENFLVGEIAGGAEEHQGVGAEFPIDVLVLYRGWPMTCTVIHSLATPSPVSAEPESHRRQELVLEVRLAARAESLVKRGGETGTGTASSIAALIVHRPSPESETRPANSESAGSFARPAAVRSSSHEAITLPRRHTSAMSRKLKSYW